MTHTTLVQLLICLLCDSWEDHRHDFSASQLTVGISDRLTFNGSESWSDSTSNNGTDLSSPSLPNDMHIGILSSKLEFSRNWIPKILQPFPVPCLFSPDSLRPTGEKHSVVFSTLLDQCIELLQTAPRELFPPKPRKLVAVELNLGDEKSSSPCWGSR